MPQVPQSTTPQELGTQHLQVMALILRILLIEMKQLVLFDDDDDETEDKWVEGR